MDISRHFETMVETITFADIYVGHSFISFQVARFPDFATIHSWNRRHGTHLRTGFIFLFEDPPFQGSLSGKPGGLKNLGSDPPLKASLLAGKMDIATNH